MRCRIQLTADYLKCRTYSVAIQRHIGGDIANDHHAALMTQSTEPIDLCYAQSIHPSRIVRAQSKTSLNIMSKTLRHPPINDTPTDPTRTTCSQDPVTPPTPPVQAIVARDEASLDDALAQTFPASDPVGELSASAYAEKDLVDDGVEQALDAAVAMTFPASDPVAISFARVSPKA